MKKTTIFILVLLIGFVIALQSLLRYHFGFIADIHNAYLTLEKKRPTLDQVESAVEGVLPDYVTPIEIEETHEEQTAVGWRIECNLVVSCDMDIYSLTSLAILQDPDELKFLDLIPKDLQTIAKEDIKNTVFIPGLPAGMTLDRRNKQLLFRRGEEIKLKVSVRASENSQGSWTTEADMEDPPWAIKTPGTYLRTALQIAEDEVQEVRTWGSIWKKYLALENTPVEKNRVLKAFAEQKKKQVSPPQLQAKKEELKTTEQPLAERKAEPLHKKSSLLSLYEPCIVKVAFFKADAVYKEQGSKLTIRITRTLKILSYTIPEGTRAFGMILKNKGKKGMEVQFNKAILPRGTVVKFNRKATVIPI